MNIRTLRKYLKIHKLNLVSFTDKTKPQTDCTEIYPHFQQNKKKQTIGKSLETNHLIQMMKNSFVENNNSTILITEKTNGVT